MHNNARSSRMRQLLAGALALGVVGGGFAITSLASAEGAVPVAPAPAATASASASTAASQEASEVTPPASSSPSPTPSRPTPPPCIVDESELATIYPGARTEKFEIMGTVHTYYYIKDTLVAQAVDGKAHTAICLMS